MRVLHRPREIGHGQALGDEAQHALALEEAVPEVEGHVAPEHVEVADEEGLVEAVALLDRLDHLGVEAPGAAVEGAFLLGSGGRRRSERRRLRCGPPPRCAPSRPSARGRSCWPRPGPRARPGRSAR